MSKLENNLKDLQAIAKEVSDLCRLQYGRGWENLTPNLRGYNADNSDHQAADVFGIDIGLHSNASFSMTIKKAVKLDQIVADAKAELAKARDTFNGKDEEEKKRLREEQIATLKRQLAEIEGEEL